MNEDEATVGTDEESREFEQRPSRKPAKKKGKEAAAKKSAKRGRFQQAKPRVR